MDVIIGGGEEAAGECMYVGIYDVLTYVLHVKLCAAGTRERVGKRRVYGVARGSGGTGERL